MSKAQMELMGMAIVLMLVALAAFFAIRMVITEKPSTAASDYNSIQLATNFLNALLETYVPDCQSSVKELMIGCVNGDSISCTGTLSTKDTCGAANKVVSDISANSLTAWGKTYELKYEGAGPVTLTGINTGCSASSNRKARLFFLPTSKGTLSVRLDICS